MVVSPVQRQNPPRYNYHKTHNKPFPKRKGAPVPHTTSGHLPSDSHVLPPRPRDIYISASWPRFKIEKLANNLTCIRLPIICSKQASSIKLDERQKGSEIAKMNKEKNSEKNPFMFVSLRRYMIFVTISSSTWRHDISASKSHSNKAVNEIDTLPPGLLSKRRAST